MPTAQKEVTQTIRLSGILDASLNKSLDLAKQQIEKKAPKIGAALSKIAGVASTIGKTALELGKQYDSALKKIRIGTGASAEQMKQYAQNLQNVFANVPNTLDESAAAVSDISTLLGYEGKNLENFSKQMLDLSALIGGDVSQHIAAANNAIKNFGISAEQSGEYTDFLFRVTQETSISFDNLADIVSKNSAILKKMGYDAQTSAVLVGQLSKQGISAEKIMSALGVASKYTTEEIEDYNFAIKNAANEQEALNLAAEIYGTKAAPEMVKAIKGGVLDSVGELNKKLIEGGNTIQGLRAETIGFSDQIQALENSLSAVFLPLLGALAEKLRGLLDNTIKPALAWWTGPNGQAFIKAISDFFGKIEKTLSALGAAALNKIFGLDKETEATGFQGLPKMAAGGWVSSPSIAGEAGTEAIISLNPAFRAENIKTWAEAGEALGVNNNNSSVYNMQGMVFSPTIQTQTQNADIVSLLQGQNREFIDMIISALNERESMRYS